MTKNKFTKKQIKENAYSLSETHLKTSLEAGLITALDELKDDYDSNSDKDKLNVLSLQYALKYIVPKLRKKSK